jgi:DNA-3-methyladenine glycosylase II
MTPDYWTRAKRTLDRRDPVMSGIIRAFPRIALTSRGEPFQTLVRSIVGQQISVKAAASIWGRLVLTAPQMRPDQILVIGSERLLACGLSRRKVEYITDLAHRFSEEAIRPAEWMHMDDERVIAELVQVRGIGRWTAEMFLMFNLLRPDVLPLDDLGLQKAVSLHYFLDMSVSRDAIRAIAEDWRPWRSVATWYLWRSLDPVPVEY